jgi:hypothetical protein
MNQAGHIFAKDARHLRWEIGISLVLTAAYVLVAAFEWNPRMNWADNGAYADEVRFATAILSLLVGVSWWVVITRVVQSESLVGDRQWWITKPYEWGSLLNAKLLFVAAFVIVPVTVAKAVVLAEGGFAPSAYLPGLAWSLLLLAVYFFVPLLALAAVTSTFARATLTILGIFAVIVVLGIAAGLLLAGGFTVGSDLRVSEAILLCGCAAAIGVQYALRRVWTARLLLAGAGLLIFAATAVSGSSALITMTYPRGNAPLQLTYAAGSQVSGYSQRAGMGRIGLAVPVHVSGLAADTVANLVAVKVTAEAADGRHWTSNWEPLWGVRYRPDSDPETIPALPVQVDRGFYNAEQPNPVTLHLRFAATTLRAGQPVRIAMPASDFAVPGFGRCMPIESNLAGDFTQLSCRNALRQPGSTLIQVQWSEGSCSAVGGGSEKPISGEGWAGGTDSDPANVGIDPVEDVNFSLSNGDLWDSGAGRRAHRHLCPGAPITFTPYAVVARTEYDVTFTNYQMPKMPPSANQ